MIQKKMACGRKSFFYNNIDSVGCSDIVNLTQIQRYSIANHMNWLVKWEDAEYELEKC